MLIRRANPALQQLRDLTVHASEDPNVVVFSKGRGDDAVIVVVNVDPRHKQSGWVELPLEDLNLDPRIPYQVHDLLTDSRYLWHGHRNYVEIDPQVVPAHIFRIRRQVRPLHENQSLERLEGVGHLPQLTSHVVGEQRRPHRAV